MESLFETLAQATRPICGMFDSCHEKEPDCKKCCRIANQSNGDEEVQDERD